MSASPPDNSLPDNRPDDRPAPTPQQASAQVLAAAVVRGERSAGSIVEDALARARRAQEAYNAFITLDEEGARAKAAGLEARLARGETLPLAGVPVVVKDNLCTKGLRTTAGSKSLVRFVPPFDATVVARLEAAGAVVVAKSNLDEFGMGSSNEHSAFGPVRNPWDPGRVPGGSSGGSAAAVAAGVAPIALGSDTGGSVRQPAAFTGLIGFKPTYGGLSRYGLIAFASSLDQVGVLCRSARDLALAVTAMSGHDPRDATSLDHRPDFLGAVTQGAEGALTGLRVGVVRELAGERNSPGVRAALARSVAALEALGANVGEASLPHARYGVATYYLVAPAEASSNLARFDGTLYGERLGENALGQTASMMRTRGRLLGPEVRRRILMGSYALSAGYYQAYYGKALKVRRLIADDFARAFMQFDLLLTPTAPTPAYTLGAKREPLAMYLGDVHTVLASLAGLPALSLPAGAAEDGLPCGVHFVAPALEDRRLLMVSAALEAAAADAFAPLAPVPPG